MLNFLKRNFIKVVHGYLRIRSNISFFCKKTIAIPFYKIKYSDLRYILTYVLTSLLLKFFFRYIHPGLGFMCSYHEQFHSKNDIVIIYFCLKGKYIFAPLVRCLIKLLILFNLRQSHVLCHSETKYDLRM